MTTSNELLQALDARQQVLQQQIRAVKGADTYVETTAAFTSAAVGSTESLSVEATDDFYVGQRVQVGLITAGAFRGGTFLVDSVDTATAMTLETVILTSSEEIPSGSRVYPVGAIASQGASIASYASLGALLVEDQSIFVANQIVIAGNVSGDRRGGVFKLVEDAALSADAGTIFASSGDNYWVRQFDAGEVNVLWFGALGDWDSSGSGSGTDDRTAIVAALAYCASSGARLVFPDGEKFGFSAKINIPPNVDIECGWGDSLYYTGVAEEAALVVNEQGASTTRSTGTTLVIGINRQTQADFTSLNNIGIQLVNVEESNIRIIKSDKFTIGVQCLGDGHGFQINTLNIGLIDNCRIDLDLHVISVESGWVNDNIFIGGHYSSGGGDGTFDHIGIRLGTDDPANDRGSINNNVFLKPCVQVGHPDATGIQVQFNGGTNNRVYNLRGETPHPRITVEFNHLAEENVVGVYTEPENVVNNGLSNIAYNESKPFRVNKDTWQSGLIVDRAVHSDDNKITIAGFGFYNIGAAASDGFALQNVESERRWIKDDILVAGVSEAREQIGLSLDVTNDTALIISRDIVVPNGTTRGSRIRIQLFDDAGVALTDANVTLAGDINWSAYSATAGGGQAEPADAFGRQSNQIGWVSESTIARVDIKFTGVIPRSISITDVGGFPVSPFVNEWRARPTIRDGLVASAEPIRGYFETGTIIWKLGQTLAAMGWRLDSGNYAVKGTIVASTSSVRLGEWWNYSGNIYQMVTALNGAQTAGATPPTHTSGTVNDGAVDWLFIATGTAAVWGSFGFTATP